LQGNPAVAQAGLRKRVRCAGTYRNGKGNEVKRLPFSPLAERREGQESAMLTG
jgi:hypothetical protein